MQRISIHIPEQTKKRISILAESKNKAEAEIIREALEEGLDKIHPKSASAKALLDLAEMMEKTPTEGNIPKDAIKNMDFYTWGGSKKGD
jgi:predicted DNA-binding protein